ncbi:MAG: nucleoside-diphosphate sugar epimerase [Conexibacter sp.]|nr:nucleoside-diphosphate sugar epimerase [Conexibacter sp.]
MTIAVTGATGAVGSRVAARLAARCDVRQRLVVRDLARVPAIAGIEAVEMGARGYRDQTLLTEALTGCSTLFLVSGREAEQRVVEHAHAVRAAVDAGIRRVVYTSFLGADPDATFTFAQDHYATEQLIRESGLAWTFLRDSQYLDYVPLVVGDDGVIRGPAGEGRCAWVARDDVADVAAAVLATDDGSHDGRTYDVTGPEAHTLEWAAQRLSEATGREIRYERETVQEAYASRALLDRPDFEVDGWVTSYAAIANGELDVVSGAVPEITGHPAQDLPGWLAANPEAWAHLRR